MNGTVFVAYCADVPLRLNLLSHSLLSCLLLAGLNYCCCVLTEFDADDCCSLLGVSSRALSSLSRRFR